MDERLAIKHKDSFEISSALRSGTRERFSGRAGPANAFRLGQSGHISSVIYCDRQDGVHRACSSRIDASAEFEGGLTMRLEAELEQVPARDVMPYSGIFPCFFGGFLSRLVSSIARAWISFCRVSCGWMIA